MYNLLLAIVLNEQDVAPQTSAVQLCMQLASERGAPQSIAPLPFTMSQTNLQRDYLTIRNAPGKLCSEQFLRVLKEASVPFTAYATHLIDKDTGQEIVARYSYWIPQWMEGSIDWERSEQWVNAETGSRHLTKLALTEAAMARSLLLFQPREAGFYLIHEKLRTRLEAALIRGLSFAPLDSVYFPYEGVKKASLERVLAEHPNDCNSWYELGNTCAVLCRYQEAITALRCAIDCNPEFEAAWYKQGVIYHTLGQLQDASHALERAIELNPRSKAWMEYSAVLRDLGRYQEAFEMAERATQLWPQTSLSWYELAVSCAALNRAKEALEAIEQGVRLGGGGGSYTAEMYRIKGEMLASLEQFDEALSSYEIGLSYAPTKRALWRDKVDVFHRLERVGEAVVAQHELDRLEQQRLKNLQKRPR